MTGVAPPQLSRDNRIGFLTVQYDQPAQDLQRAPGERLAAVSAIGERAGLEVSRRGPIVDQAEQMSAPVGELIGLAVAVLVLTLVFRSVASMLLTLIASLIALGRRHPAAALRRRLHRLPELRPDARRDARPRRRDRLRAADRRPLPRAARRRRHVAHSARVANATAGTSVVAAGAIVVVAIAGLLATGIPFVGRMGVGSAIVVATVAVGAVTVLPTLMGAFARRLRPKNPAHGRAQQGVRALGDRASSQRPRTAAIAGTLVLLALATPVLGLRLGMPDDGNDAKGTTTRVAYDRLAEGFGVGFNGPLVLATTTRATCAQIRAAARRRPASRSSPSRSSRPARTPPR